MARLDPIAPEQLDARQRVLYDEMRPLIEEHLTGFVSARGDDALVGPFNAMLHFPDWGEGAWAQTKSLIEHTTLPKPAHEVAILVIGAAFGARYELYAHEHVAEQAGLSAPKIAALAAGQRPGDLTVEEGIAHDVAAALTRGPLPGTTYTLAVRTFGETATAELIFLVGGYCLVSTLLNAYDVSVPGSGDGTAEPAHG